MITSSSEEDAIAYKKLKQKVWEMRDYYKEREGLKFKRLNPINKHETGKYHYIWEILLK